MIRKTNVQKMVAFLKENIHELITLGVSNIMLNEFIERIVLIIRPDALEVEVQETVTTLCTLFFVNKIFKDRPDIEIGSSEGDELVFQAFKVFSSSIEEDQNIPRIISKMRDIELQINYAQIDGLDPVEEYLKDPINFHSKYRGMRRVVNTLVKDSGYLLVRTPYLQLRELAKALSGPKNILSEEELDDCVTDALVIVLGESICNSFAKDYPDFFFAPEMLSELVADIIKQKKKAEKKV